MKKYWIENSAKGFGGTEYWLLRHGKAPHNKPDEIATFAGGRVNNPLSEEGKAETEKLAKEIVLEVDFDLIIVSHMARSRQTGEIIARKLEELKGKKIDVIEIDDLQEVDVGDFTGHTEKEAREMSRKSTEAFYSGEIEKWNFPGGENHNRIAKRIENVINRIRKLSEDKTRVLVVGHGMFNRAINHYLARGQEELWRPRSYPHDQIIIFNLGPYENK